MLEEVFDKNNFNRLAREMRNGDRKATETLYENLINKVFGFCLSRVRSKATAEDLTQEIFMKLVEKIELYDNKKGDFVVWFWQLARNTIIDYYRRGKETSFSDLENEEESLEAKTSYSPGAAFDNQLQKEKIEMLLDSFTEDEQELFRLRFLSELSYKEIAKILNKSEGSLRVAINRLKKKIKSNLEYEKF